MKSIVTGFDVSRSQHGVRRKFVAAALLCIATIAAPNLAQARGGGGGFHGAGGFGGFHGAGGFGGLQAGGSVGFHPGTLGGSRSGGISGGEVHPTAPLSAGNGKFRAEGFSGGEIHPGAALSAGMNGFHADTGRGGSGTGTVVLRGGDRDGRWQHGWRNGHYGWVYDPYLWSDDGIYDGYDASTQMDASGDSYYCPDPAGYYPSVTQCNASWQTVPAN